MFLAYFHLLTLLTATVTQTEPIKILFGSSGNGKSYIASRSETGCQASTCPGGDASKACTLTAQVCNLVIDTVGLNHADDKKQTVKFEGRDIPVSGLFYPLYNLLEALEQHKVFNVEFYHVILADNVRSGYTFELFQEHVLQPLNCPITTIINKFEPHKPEHQELKKYSWFKNGGIIVEYRQEHITLKGNACEFALDKNWRKSILNGDITAVRAMVDRKRCQELWDLKNRTKEISNILADDSLHLEDCTERVYECDFIFIGFCVDDSVRIIQNPDCVARRAITLQHRNEKRESLQKELDLANQELRNSHEEVNRCDFVVNF